MAIYEYQCLNEECGEEFELLLPMSECDTPQVCPVCGADTEKLVSQSDFILKGDGWFGKAHRVEGQMLKRREKVKQKMRDHVDPGYTSVPNVNGEETGTWSEAKKLAKDKGLNASSYDSMIQKEKGGK
jgi:putative FmdB family regulatory protein